MGCLPHAYYTDRSPDKVKEYTLLVVIDIQHIHVTFSGLRTYFGPKILDNIFSMMARPLEEFLDNRFQKARKHLC